ncbi:hypothetical protein AAFF_G00366790 [Aldrovandia affinis]|uniref:Uncharacterized protein n=1 Tax=Aldrovandia affinis TaxID=143900 RepID=A0AAD7WMK1_9TELE|nr:hypothetical protein AAFF_G00366790 [Aldrovandia affinis]
MKVYADGKSLEQNQKHESKSRDTTVTSRVIAVTTTINRVTKDTAASRDTTINSRATKDTADTSRVTAVIHLFHLTTIPLMDFPENLKAMMQAGTKLSHSISASPLLTLRKRRASLPPCPVTTPSTVQSNCSVPPPATPSLLPRS